MLTVSPKPSAADDVSSLVLEQATRLFRDYVSPDLLESAEAGKWPAALWNAISEAGLTLALVPDAAGGADIDPRSASLLIRTAAYHPVPVPLAETMTATSMWARAGGQIFAGVWSFAPCNPEDKLEMKEAGSGCELSGTVRGVPWAEQADFILLRAIAETKDNFLVAVPKGTVPVKTGKNLAGEPRGTLSFERTPLPRSNAVKEKPSAGNRLLEAGAFIRSQQMVGAMERCLDLALEYAQQRRQFGRPIGKFQAVQHMLADAAGHYAAALASSNLAVKNRDTAESDFYIAVAKARTGEAAGRVSEICHQVHGAMGFAREYPLHFSTRRLLAWRDEFAGESFWQTRLGQRVCRHGGASLWPAISEMP